MSFSIHHVCLLSLTVSPVPRSSYKTLTVSNFCWLSFIISSGPIELLNISHCHLLVIAFCKLHGTEREIERRQEAHGYSDRDTETLLC